jgi:hypothetical protein
MVKHHLITQVDGAMVQARAADAHEQQVAFF